MIIETKFFEEITVEPSDLLIFDKPIFGFEDVQSYVLIEIDEMDSLYCLQSTTSREVCFFVVDPWAYFPDYAFDLDSDLKKELNLTEDNVRVLSIATIPAELKDLSLNLIAPIILNKKTSHAVQTILNNDNYSSRHYVRDHVNTY